MISPQKSKEKGAKKITAAINNSPLPVLIEFPDGEEYPIDKAYCVTGRTAAIKILIDCESEKAKNQYEKDDLNDQIKTLENEVDDLKDCKKELEEWTYNFEGEPKDVKKQWDAIEESISDFADVAGMSLVANDADNINRLRKSFELRFSELNDADETIGELKLENLAKDKKIKDYEQTLLNIRNATLIYLP